MVLFHFLNAVAPFGQLGTSNPDCFPLPSHGKPQVPLWSQRQCQPLGASVRRSLRRAECMDLPQVSPWWDAESQQKTTISGWVGSPTWGQATKDVKVCGRGSPTCRCRQPHCPFHGPRRSDSHICMHRQGRAALWDKVGDCLMENIASLLRAEHHSWKTDTLPCMAPRRASHCGETTGGTRR